MTRSTSPRSIAFGNNHRPGVMLAGAAQTYLNRYGVRVGDSIPAALHDVAWTCSATPVAGVLAPLPQMPGPLHHYSALALSTHGRFAYAAGDVGGAGALALLHRDPLTGALALADGVDLLLCESTFLSSEANLAEAAARLRAVARPD